MDTSLLPPPVSSRSPSSILDRLRASHTQGLVLLKNSPLRKGDVTMWMGMLKNKLRDLYGASAPIIKLYHERIVSVQKNGITSEQFALYVTMLKGLIDQMEHSAGSGILNPVSTASVPPSGKNIFIIHGHDELNTNRLTLLLQNQFHTNPVVIISEAGMSRPLIDKYEDSASMCSFAFAIVTPDDEIAASSGSYHQARPNVIFELGWFVGRLGKHRVAILLKDGTKIHSDFDGVSRIQFRDNVEDKYLDIQKELAAAGII